MAYPTEPASPFPASSAAAGHGRIVARLLPDGVPALEAITFQYPLKLITPPRPSDLRSALVFLLSYGGGLVGGDSVHLAVDVEPGARLCMVTQGYTKIFKAPTSGTVTRQTLRVRIASGAGLCLLPDPVQPFGGSNYEQDQVFRLEGPAASLVLLDWVTQGRVARGEDWDLVRWAGRNEVWQADAVAGGRATAGDSPPGRLLVRDRLILDSSRLPEKDLRGSMQAMGVFGTLMLRGPLARSLGDFFLAEFAAMPRIGARDFRTDEAKRKEQAEQAQLSPRELWRRQRLEEERRTKVLWTAARARGCVVVKFGTPSTETGREWLASMLTREGSIAREFGEQALICLR